MRPTRRAAGRFPAFDGRVNEPRPLRSVEPNAVLRGGPLDGEQVTVGGYRTIGIQLDGERAVYRPTSELDTEFPTLAVWVWDHTEQA